METILNSTIVAYLVFGACFGLATGSYQHIFSEGPSRPGAPGNRFLWVLICTFLWPIMVLTGVLSMVKLRARAKAAAQRR